MTTTRLPDLRPLAMTGARALQRLVAAARARPRAAIAVIVTTCVFAAALVAWPDDRQQTGVVAVGADPDDGGPATLILSPAQAPPAAPIRLQGYAAPDDGLVTVTVGGRTSTAVRLPDGTLQTRVPLYLEGGDWPSVPGGAQVVEVHHHGRLVAASADGLRVMPLERAPGTTSAVQRSLATATTAYERIFAALPAQDATDMAHRRALLTVLRSLVDEGDHSLAAVLSGTSPLLEGGAPDLDLVDAVMASSGTAAGIDAFARALGGGPPDGVAGGSGQPMLLSLSAQPFGVGAQCRAGGKDMELACLMQVQGLLDDLAIQFIRPTADTWANFTTAFPGGRAGGHPAATVISALMSVTNLVIGKVAPSLLPAQLSRFELELPRPLIRLHETTQSRIVVEARNTPQSITLNDFIDIIKSTVGAPVKLDKLRVDDIDPRLLEELRKFFYRVVDLYMLAMRGADHVRPGSSDAVNPGVFTLPMKTWGPVEVTNPDLVTLFSYEPQIVAPREDELEWRGERHGQATVRVRPRGPGDRSKVLQDNTLCPGCVWSGGAFGTDMPDSSTKVAVELELEASPMHGHAPLDVRLRWKVLPREDGAPMPCTLDFGDGTAVERIADCGKTRSFRHTYRHTSRLEDGGDGAFLPTLRLDEGGAEGSTEVFTEWTFEASPDSGEAPLDTRFRWDIPWPEGREAPACELDPGDGSDRLKFDDCLETTVAEHRFERRGSFVPTLTLSYRSATDTKTTPVSVAEDGTCAGLLEHKAWTGRIVQGRTRNVTNRQHTTRIEYRAATVASGLLKERDRKQHRGQDHLVSYYNPEPEGMFSVTDIRHGYAPVPGGFKYKGFERFMGGALVPQEPGMAEQGSFLVLVLKSDCSYSFDFQGQVEGTRTVFSATSGQTTTTRNVRTWLARVHGEGVVTSAGTISGSGAFDVLSGAEFEDRTRSEGNAVTETDAATSVLRGRDLGQDSVSWHFAPVE